MAKRRLGDISKITAGQAAPKIFSSEGHPFIRAGHLENLINGLNINSLPKINEDTAQKRGLKKIPKGSILFAKSGMSATKCRIYITPKETYIVSHLAAIWPSEEIEQNYLARFLLWYNPAKLILDDAYPSIRLSEISKLNIPLPPLKTQQKIAAILDKADRLVQLNRQLLEKYDQLAQSLFLEMFGDPAFNPFQFPEIELIDLVRTKDDIKCGPFGTQLSKSEYMEEGVPIWGIPQVNSDFQKKPTEYVTESKAESLASYSVISQDIVMSRKGNVGSCAIYPLDWPKGILHSDVLRIRCDNEKLSAVFLAWQFRLSRRLKTQVNNVSSGAIMAGINVGKLKHISPIVPPLALQVDFAKKVGNIESQKSLAQQSLQKSQDLFQSLLQKAFTGELIKEESFETA